jgi:hypothetical protein
MKAVGKGGSFRKVIRGGALAKRLIVRGKHQQQEPRD